MSIPKREARGAAKFIDSSFDTPKKSMKRYYIWLQPKLAESSVFPFKEKEILIAYVEDERLVIEKM